MLKNIDASRTFFYITIFMLIFIYGVIVGAYKIFPHDQILFMKNAIILVKDEAGMITKIKPTRHVSESRYSGNGITINNEHQASPGFTLITSFFDNDLELRLIDNAGTVLNRWPARMFDIWENFDHVAPEYRPKTDWNTVFNGVVLLPDGSVVFNLNHIGLINMDRCGNVQWKVSKMTHHSVELSSDGGYWVGGQRLIEGKTKHLPFKVPYFEDTILKISKDGFEILELSIMDILYKNNLHSVITSNNRRLKHHLYRDITHLNDIEELTADTAKYFPQFEAGDLLVSIREPNMIFIISPSTQIIKWFQVGPWVQQHDPDFQSDGTITLFDNQYDTTDDGSLFGGSRIVRIDPKSGISEVLYGGKQYSLCIQLSKGITSY